MSMRSPVRSYLTSNRPASCAGHNRDSGSKREPGKISRLWRLADSKDDSEGANQQAATEREHEQQPNREVRQLDHAFADKAAAAGKQVGNSASEYCHAEQNHCTQPSRFAPCYRQLGHNAGGKSLVVDIRRDRKSTRLN